MDIKESKEAIIGLVTLGAFVAKRAKDGIDLGDAGALFQALVGDPVFREKVVGAAKGAELIPAELADLSFEEGIELSLTLVNALRDGLS